MMKVSTMTNVETKPGVGRTVSLPFGTVLDRVTDELRKEGFGVLTRVDVKATLKEKLGQEMAPFVILGACNPGLAHRALAIEPEVGLMLPCNVVVREVADGQVRVEAVNALAMMSLFPNVGLSAIATEVNARLTRVVNAV